MREPNRERKNEIKYGITLNDEQKDAKRIILESQVSVVTGPPGTGKTLLCAQIALDLLNKKQINQVLLIRPTIQVGQSLGYLPGGLEEKLDPYFEAFMDCIRQCAKEDMVAKWLDKDHPKIKSIAIQFIRGMTFSSDTLVVCDEMQNSTIAEMMAILSRIGKDSKLIIVGDNGQQDTKDAITGLKFTQDMSVHIPDIKLIKLKSNHRSEIVEKIWSYYNKYRNA
jgi:phosphate starvation-inducible PhoH-like protein